MADSLSIDLPERWSPDDFYSLMYQSEHDATWRILESINDEKNFVAKLHGGFFAIAPLVVGVVGADTLLTANPAHIALYLAVGLCVLAVLSYRSFIDCDFLRLQQQELDKAAEIARWKLADGRRSYFTLSSPSTSGACRLFDQHDPVSNDGKTVMMLAALDFIGVLAAISLALRWSYGVPVAALLATSTFVLVAAALLTRRGIDRRWRAVDRAIRRKTSECMAREATPPRGGVDGAKAATGRTRSDRDVAEGD